MGDKEPVRYDAPGVEPPVHHEESLQTEIQDLITRVQSHNFSSHRHGFRGTHVKTQAIVKGTFTVQPGLAPHLAHGICSAENAAKPHAVAIRFANEPSFLQDDRAPGPRGCGMRIFDVKGAFMDAIGKATQTQDLTFNNAPVLELRDVSTTVEIFKIRERNFFTPDKIPQELEKRPDKELQFAPSQLPNRHFLSYVMYSQSAFRWGPYVAKYALFPTSALQKKLEDEAQVTEDSGREVHREWLKEFFEANDAEYELRVQLCRDPEQQSVEDTSVQWDEGKVPFETVGKVVLHKGQDSFSADRRRKWDDGVKLNVWYGLEEHRPLGSVNRLRRELYKRSAKNREGMNGVKVEDLASIDQLPD